AHRDAHAIRALVAQAEDALPVGDDNDADIGYWPVFQDIADVTAVIDRDKQTARPAEYVAILLAGLADSRGVDDGHHLLDVVDQYAIKQRFVTIFHTDHEDI